MATKVPTAHGISGLLRRADFGRYDTTITRTWPGYRVTADSPGRVRVDHMGDRLARASMQAKYAEAISEQDWTVSVAEFWLIITAKGRDDA